MVFKHYYMIVLLIFFVSPNNTMAMGLRENIQKRSISLMVRCVDFLIEPFVHPMPQLQEVKRYFKLKAIANYAPSRLAKKLKKITDLNYDEEYHNKYVTERILVRERVAQRAAEKLESTEQALNDQICLNSEDLMNYSAIRKDIGTKIVSESYPGIWFKAPGKGPFKLEDSELTPIQIRIVASLKKCMSLFDIESMIIDTSFYNKSPMAMDIYAKEIPLLLYNEDTIASYPDYELDLTMVHECAHAQFKHALRYFRQYNDWPDGLHALQYYREQQANTHASLMFPKEYEALSWQKLEIALRITSKINEQCFEDNDPTKGCPNNDVHPSWLREYIRAFKIRNLLEAEQRWFSTEEANERYGSVYYDRAWQKWATAQNELTK